MWAAAKPKCHVLAIYTVAYLTMGEVLWRMTRASTPWEYGKYSVVLVMLILLYQRKPNERIFRYCALVMCLLAPATALSIGHFGLGEAAREAISFNLSGPMALVVAVACFSSFTYEEIDINRMLMAFTLPTISIGAITAWGILRSSIQFGSQANMAASGGYGPNQVSAILGFGAVAAMLLVLRLRRGHVRLAFTLLGAWFLVQALLTFSRGGLFNFAACFLVLGVHYLNSRRSRFAFLTITFAGLLIGSQFLLPRLESFTGGALSARFSSTSTTGRTQLAEGDLELWRRNPVLGTGVGVAAYKRHSGFYQPVAPHTEYTRLVAEHGTLGALALAVLLLIAASLYREAPTILTKAWVASLTTWAMAAMTHTAMRNAVISVVFGLAAISWRSRDRTIRPAGRRSPFGVGR